MKHGLITVAAILYFSPLAAQYRIDRSVIGSAGGQADQSGYHIEYTLGELAVSTHDAGNIILAEGFHQGYVLITSVRHLPGVEDFSVSPTS